MLIDVGWPLVHLGLEEQDQAVVHDQLVHAEPATLFEQHTNRSSPRQSCHTSGCLILENLKHSQKVATASTINLDDVGKCGKYQARGHHSAGLETC